MTVGSQWGPTHLSGCLPPKETERDGGPAATFVYSSTHRSLNLLPQANGVGNPGEHEKGEVVVDGDWDDIIAPVRRIGILATVAPAGGISNTAVFCTPTFLAWPGGQPPGGPSKVTAPGYCPFSRLGEVLAIDCLGTDSGRDCSNFRASNRESRCSDGSAHPGRFWAAVGVGAARAATTNRDNQAMLNREIIRMTLSRRCRWVDSFGAAVSDRRLQTTSIDHSVGPPAFPSRVGRVRNCGSEMVGGLRPTEADRPTGWEIHHPA